MIPVDKIDMYPGRAEKCTTSGFGVNLNTAVIDAIGRVQNLLNFSLLILDITNLFKLDCDGSSKLNSLSSLFPGTRQY